MYYNNNMKNNFQIDNNNNNDSNENKIGFDYSQMIFQSNQRPNSKNNNNNNNNKNANKNNNNIKMGNVKNIKYAISIFHPPLE